MPIHDPDRVAEVLRGPGRRPLTDQGRAYFGPAHGAQWPVVGREPPPWVELPFGASSALYRLVRQPRTGRPARDRFGNFLYLPITSHHTAAPDATDARVIAFPQSGVRGRPPHTPR